MWTTLSVLFSAREVIIIINSSREGAVAPPLATAISIVNILAPLQFWAPRHSITLENNVFFKLIMLLIMAIGMMPVSFFACYT
jgi:hypothetical protein